MSNINIVSVKGGWDILLNGEKMSFIEAGSFFLKDIRFRQNGEKLIQFHMLLWTLYVNQLYPYIWSENYSVKVNKNKWKIIAKNTDKNMKAETEMTVLPDGEGIKYLFKQSLTILSDFDKISEYFDENEKRYFKIEFTDPYWQSVVGPAYEFSGFWPGIYYPGLECNTKDWKKRWSMYVTENPNGNFVGRIHNHLNASNNWMIAKNGIIVGMDEKIGNPAYRFFTDGCCVSMCLWGYDTHFNILSEGKITDDKIHFKKGQEFSVEYELFCLKDEETKQIKEKMSVETLDNMIYRPIVEEGINKFDKVLELSDPLSMAWHSWCEGTSWDTECGYDDNYSLRLDSDGTVFPSWENRVGQEMFMKPLETGKKYRLAMYLKTKGVEGKGVYAGVDYGVPRYPGMHGELLPAPLYRTESITGDNEWIPIEVITDAVPCGAISARIIIKLEGAGTVWIDNLLFEAID